MKVRAGIAFLALVAILAFAQETFEGQKAIVISNGTLELTVMPRGATIANLILADDAGKLSPLWNPVRLAREAGRTANLGGGLGHFVCVDGFGQPSEEERASGLPGHGEAHLIDLEVSRQSNSLTLSGKLPIVQENFTRTFHVVPGENVVYVDSALENLMGFDRPVVWAEHATVSSPFVQAGKTATALSGTRSQNRDYTAGRGGQQQGRGGQQQAQRRLAPGKDFTWPLSPGLDGQQIDLHITPEDPHFIDHAATLMDPARDLEFATVFNSEKSLVYGYIFRRSDYPWMQHWNNMPSASQITRGLEFGTQPYDVPRRQSIALNTMFGAPTFRWLPAKGRIESHFLLFYARTPAGFTQVDDARLENGRILIEDKKSGQRVSLAASRGLPLK